MKIQRELPKPTFKNPYVQVDWIWEQFLCRYKNKKTIEGGRARLAAYKRFLREANGNDERLKNDPRFYLAVHWDHFALYNAEGFWRAAGYSTSTVHSYIKGLKNVLDFASSQGLTSVPEFIYPQIKVERETKVREAYSEEELQLIRKIISETNTEAQRVLSEYKKTGVGLDPRGTGSFTQKIDGVGWMYWENMVWYFENVMECQPSPETSKGRILHSGFFRAARIYHGGIENVWEKLTVLPYVGSELIVPLAMKLAWETGLNPESILNLKRDCYHDKHELSGFPFVRYYKERSNGEKDLHLALFDDENTADLHLVPKQSEIIRRTIDLILKLTEPLVEKALPADKNYLLLFRSLIAYSSNVSEEGIMRVNKGTLQNWSSSARKKLKKINGKTLDVLNLVRFRATKITQMVRDGHDFFRVQAVAGHASVRTTARYLADYQLEAKAREEVQNTLIQIQRNAQELSESPKQYATSVDNYDPKFIYKGVMCDCKNPFDPPKAVKNLSSYREGQSCSYWNMCLFCPNIIITRKHLPLLVSYSREINDSLRDKNLNQTPATAQYRKAKSILSEIFREFPEEDIAWANQIAESSDAFADGVVYHAVKNY